MKIYITGKITGEPVMKCIRKFEEAQFMITRTDEILKHVKSIMGFAIPLYFKGIYFGIEHEEAMKICLKELKKCDAIYMIRDWRESKRATREHSEAVKLELKIFYQ